MTRKAVCWGTWVFLALTSVGPLVAAGTDTTCIVVVGTVHAETGNFSVQTLCTIFDRVRPDLVLVELDSSFMTPSMTIRPEFITASLENLAVSQCTQDHVTPIRPYDIAGRNTIYEQHNYFEVQKEVSRALRRALQDSLVGAKGRILLDAITRFDEIGRAFGSERPEIINSAACDAAMESKQFYAGEGMLQVVASLPSLSQFVEFCRFRRDFWIARNDAMVKNIVKWTRLLQPKTVLVLCGFEHRYYLRTALQMLSASNAISLREYWAY